MSDSRRHEALIDVLGAELVPVRRLLPPWLRTLGWLVLVAAFALLLFAHYGEAPMLRRWASANAAQAAVAAVSTAPSAAQARSGAPAQRRSMGASP